MSTGEFSVAGGYSTSDGFMGEVSIGERNLLGLGLYAKASLQFGQHASGAQLSFVEPYFLGYRVALGVDLFTKKQLATSFVSYDTRTSGAGLRLGFSLREDLSLQLRYSIYSQKVTLPATMNNCNNLSPDFLNTFPTPNVVGLTPGTTPPVPLPNALGQTDCFATAKPAGGTQGTGEWLGHDLVGWLRSELQYARQQSKSDERHSRGAQAGFCRRRRRRELPAHDRRYQDLYEVILTSWACCTCRAAISRDGATTDCGCSTTSRWAQLVRGFAPSGIGPAI
jgi:hypothetical protein